MTALLLSKPDRVIHYGRPDVLLESHVGVGVGKITDSSVETNDMILYASRGLRDPHRTKFGYGVDGGTVVGGELYDGSTSALTYIVKLKDIKLISAKVQRLIVGEMEDLADANASKFVLGIKGAGIPALNMYDDGAVLKATATGATITNLEDTHTIAVVYDPTDTGAEAKIYVDDIAAVTASVTGPFSATPNGCRVGSADQITYAHGAYCDIIEIARFASALSAETIEAYYNGTFPADTCAGRWVFTNPFATVADAAGIGCWDSSTRAINNKENGVGNDAFGSTWVEANQPVMALNAVNGLPAISFNGSTQQLSQVLTNALETYTSAAGHIFAVVKTDSAIAEQVIFSISNPAGAGIGLLQFGLSSGNKIHYKVNASSTTVELAGDDNVGTGYALLEWESDGSTITMRVNGVDQANTEVQGTDAGYWFADTDAATTRQTLGALYNNNTVSGYFDGQIAQLRVYDSQISVKMAARVRARLNNMYGL